MKKITLRKSVVAAQWGDATVDYVVADRQAGKIHILAAGLLRWGDPPNDQEGEPQEAESSHPRSPGEALAAELRRLGQRRADLVVALGRGSVDVIPLQLPPAADVELPTLVNNQVMRDAGEIAETGVVDFVAVPAQADEPRTGFAFAVDTVAIERVKEEAEKAGLKVAAIAYRPLASVALLHRVVPQSPRTMILVTLHDREADISIVRNGALIYTRTARLSETHNVGDIAAQLAMEVRRSLAAASLAPDTESQHLYMFGALRETEQMVQDLAEELSLPASLLDPLRTEHVDGPTPESVGRLTPLLGMVHEHYDNAHAVDFLHPKEPPPPPNYVRRAGFYAAAALVVLAIGGYMVVDARSQASERVKELRASLKKTTQRLDKVKKKQAVVDAVLQWESDNVNWLDEFYDLARRFPSGRDAMVRRFSIRPGRGGASVINMNVNVRDPEVVTMMGDNLRDDYHDVRSKGVSEQSASTDYPWQFETQITLRPRDKQEYQHDEPDDPPNKKTDADIAATPFNRHAQRAARYTNWP